MIKVKAYSFGERFIVPDFRRTMNEALVNNFAQNTFRPDVMLLLADYTFENIPSDRPLLQLLVDNFCKHWNVRDDDKGDTEALEKLPRKFVTRALSTFSHNLFVSRQIKNKDRCYLEHATDVAKEACGKFHMAYNEDRDYGYFQRLL